MPKKIREIMPNIAITPSKKNTIPSPQNPVQDEPPLKNGKAKIGISNNMIPIISVSEPGSPSSRNLTKSRYALHIWSAEDTSSPVTLYLETRLDFNIYPAFAVIRANDSSMGRSNELRNKS